MDVVVSLGVAIVVIGIVYFYLKSESGYVKNTIDIKHGTEDGRTEFSSKQALPKSFNQPEGITFSYTCWVRIDNFAYRYGQQRLIFTKGPTDLSTMSPALLIDANTNSLLVKLSTFGNTEVVPIPNIPAKKWIHVAIAVDQDAMEVYINGTLRTHHTLTQLPRQNTDTVHTGVQGGFDGKIALLQYYSHFLTPSDVATSMQAVPKEQKEENVLPPYFDISWWTTG